MLRVNIRMKNWQCGKILNSDRHGQNSKGKYGQNILKDVFLFLAKSTFFFFSFKKLFNWKIFINFYILTKWRKLLQRCIFS